jgi:hypothetical protein
MGITLRTAMGTGAHLDDLLPLEPAVGWLARAPGRGDHGLIDRALRAAAIVWQPDRFAAIPPTAKGDHMVLPNVLEAWRAAERELSARIDMTHDSPGRQLLEANATMLRATYQRLYLERTSR